MEEIIKAFGIDGRIIIIQIVNFTILMVALGYFLYNPILNLLREREEKIAHGIRDAEAAAAALGTAEEEKKGILTLAHASATEVNTRAKLAAEDTAAIIVRAAEEKAEGVMRDALKKAELLRGQVVKEAEAEIAKTAMLAAEQVLRSEAA